MLQADRPVSRLALGLLAVLTFATVAAAGGADTWDERVVLVPSAIAMFAFAVFQAIRFGRQQRAAPGAEIERSASA